MTVRTMGIAALAAWACAATARGQDAPAGPAGPVSLSCDGSIVVEGGHESISTSVSATGRRRTTDTWSSRTRHVDATFGLIFDPAGASRVRPAAAFVPGLNSGGAGGWWTLTDVAITPDRLSGRFRLNLLDKPLVLVDRISGRVTVEGLSTFRGECRKADLTARKF